MRAAAVVLVALVACSQRGALHQGTLVGQCAEDDAACQRRHALGPIAVGARVYPELATTIDGTTTPALHVESAAPEVIAVEEGALIAKRPGVSAVLMTTDDGAVVDFVHVWAAPAERVILSRRDGERMSGPLGLMVGDDVTLTAAVYGGAVRLAGEADAQWSARDPATIALLGDGSLDRRRIHARAPGRTTVTVALGGASTALDVEVLP